MPYESEGQKKFFRMCLHNPKHAKGQCPDLHTIQEFEKHEPKKMKKPKGK